MKLVILIIGLLTTAVLVSAQQPTAPATPTAPTAPPALEMQPEPPGQMQPPPAAAPMAPQTPRSGMQSPTLPHGPTAPQPPQPPMDPLGDALFPPEMIMGHTRELGLTNEQKLYMRGEIQKTTSRFTELQWQLQDAMEALHDTMKLTSVNEQQALAQLNRVLDTEREIKTLHITMAIRLKNNLTPDQQEKLQAMRTPRPGPLAPTPAP